MTKRFYSYGKLLITGEYLVLNGAKALAVPVSRGQSLEVFSNNGTKGISWKAVYNGNPWVEAHIDFNSNAVKHYTGRGDKKFLAALIKSARKLNPDFLKSRQSYRVLTSLEFSPEWGLGSSSTLISNVASWAQVDPFELNKLVSSGSGFDIAVAQSELPILYQKKNGYPVFDPVRFYPTYTSSLYLVWLGKKTATEQNIKWYKRNIRPTKKAVNAITDLTNEIWQAPDIGSFCSVLKEHNRIMESVLGSTPVQEKLFPDFEGVVKSLGAWGGDFILVASNAGSEKVKTYFENKGYHTIFNWDELVKTENGTTNN